VELQEGFQLPTEGLGPLQHLGARPLVSQRFTRPEGELVAVATDPAGDPWLGDVLVPPPLDDGTDLGTREGEVVQAKCLSHSHQHVVLVGRQGAVAVEAAYARRGAVIGHPEGGHGDTRLGGDMFQGRLEGSP